MCGSITRPGGEIRLRVIPIQAECGNFWEPTPICLFFWIVMNPLPTRLHTQIEVINANIFVAGNDALALKLTEFVQVGKFRPPPTAE